jgi:hypothetical protein
MLIFDNADAVEDIRPWIPRGLMPPGIPGHVLVTTRRRSEFSALGPVLELDLLELEEAVALLRTRVAGMAEETARIIATELDRLPLALEQAAAYMDRVGSIPSAIRSCSGSARLSCSSVERWPGGRTRSLHYGISAWSGSARKARARCS